MTIDDLAELTNEVLELRRNYEHLQAYARELQCLLLVAGAQHGGRFDWIDGIELCEIEQLIDGGFFRFSKGAKGFNLPYKSEEALRAAIEDLMVKH